MQIAEAKKRLTIPQLWFRLQLAGKPKRSCRCPWRRDRHPSFSVFADGAMWKDHATGQSGDAVDFFRMATGLSQQDACRQFIELASGGWTELHPRVTTQLDVPPIPPILSKGTTRDWLTLSCARSISPEAVELAVRRGLLWFGFYRHRPAWFVTDSSRHVVQARRMDKMRWWPKGPKAMTLPGGHGSWPVGASEVEPFSSILLVEGGPDLLAGFHFLILAGSMSRVTAVAMLGATNNIHPMALGLLGGKVVGIIPHMDKPNEKGWQVGIDAARRWQSQLQSAGAIARIINIGDFIPKTENLKDLNDASRLPITHQTAIAKGLADL